MRRREFIAALGFSTALGSSARAQGPARSYSILWVSTEAQPDPFIAGFREGMEAHGYVEGRNLSFVLRYAPGDPAALQAKLPELLATPADLIVSSGPAIRAMRAATQKPVLFAVSGDPVELGVAESLARPGRNFTGSTFLSLELAQKRVQLIRELLPDLRTLAILSNANHPGEQSEHEATKEAASALSIRLAYAPFRTPRRSTAHWSACVFRARMRCSSSPTRSRWCTAPRFGWREYCDAGGLASYGSNQRATYVRLASYADRLLRGEAPGGLPVEQPTAFEFILNLKAAKAIGVEIPPALLARADEVIE
jgi:putative tryptophan/tyrosine transport system substrate-binding protein